MKKIIVFASILLLSFAFVSCDFLSTILAAKDFSVEYTTYSEIYENAEIIVIDTDTSITIDETNVVGLVDKTASVKWVDNNVTDLAHLTQTIDSISKESIINNYEGLLIEYVITGTTVTPTIPENTIDAGDNVFNFDDSFSLTDIENELKTGTRSFAFDINLNQVIDLENVDVIADQLRIFDQGLEMLSNAIAHVEITFSDIDNMIDVTVALDAYRLDFSEEQYAIITILNHTVITNPATYEMPDIFGDAFVMLAVDDIRLARKVYEPGVAIVLPFIANQSGWIQIHLEAGTYQIMSAQFGLFSSSFLAQVDETVIPYDSVGSIQVTITVSGFYFFKIIPTVDLTTDITFTPVV
jgi:hypothetical protein